MIIGLTGGIASGKSEVCRTLERAGFIVIDADVVAHEVLEDPEIIAQAVSMFGDKILAVKETGAGPDAINRKALGKIVFADPEKMKAWEEVTHPQVVKRIRETVADQNRNYVIEAIALVKSGLIDICDEFWVVHAEPEQQLKRLTENRKLSYEDALARLESQKDHDWDESRADRIIYSTEPLESMTQQVNDALKNML